MLLLLLLLELLLALQALQPALNELSSTDDIAPCAGPRHRSDASRTCISSLTLIPDPQCHSSGQRSQAKIYKGCRGQSCAIIRRERGDEA